MKPSDSAVETARFQRSSVLGGLDLLSARYIRHRFSAHFHDEYVVAVIERGVQRFTSGSRSGVLTAGDVLVMFPGEVHTGWAGIASGWSYRAFYLPQDAVDRLKEAHAEEPHRLRHGVIRDGPLAKILAETHDTLENTSDRFSAELLIVDSFCGLMDTGSRASHDRRLPHPAVRRVRDFLEENFAARVSLRELGQIAGTSVGHLSRSFRAATGLAPYAYLLQCRIRAAKRMLETGLSPSHAAVLAGFVDESHLSRQFRRMLGVPPGQWARGICADRTSGTARHFP